MIPGIEGDKDLLEVLNDIEPQIEFGAPIKPEIAECIEKTVKRPLKKDSLSKLTAELKVPENCKGLVVPKMNQEIWSNLPPRARLNDLALQSHQQNASHSLVAYAQLADIIAKNSDKMPKELPRQLLSIIRDAANVAGNGFQVLSQKRRSEVKPHLNNEFASICSASVPVNEYLFGSDLKEALKASKAASMVVRQSFSRRPNFRNKPYSTNYRQVAQSSTRPLNWNRPAQQPPLRAGWKPSYQSRGQVNRTFQRRPYNPPHQ